MTSKPVFTFPKVSISLYHLLVLEIDASAHGPAVQSKGATMRLMKVLLNFLMTTVIGDGPLFVPDTSATSAVS